MTSTIAILFLIPFLFGTHFGEKLGYEDVTGFARNCSGFEMPEKSDFRCIRISAKEGNLNGFCQGNTCSLNGTVAEDNLSSEFCECKPSCVKHKTCCMDFPNKLMLGSISRQDSEQYSCEDVKRTEYLKPIYMKNKCKCNGKYDKAVIPLCEDEVNISKDPMGVLPVTNPTTSTTYKNYFCAICNDDISDLIFWNIGVDVLTAPHEFYAMRKLDNNQVFGKLMYDNLTGEWGILIDDPTPRPPLRPGVTEDPKSNKVFKHVHIFVGLPDHLKDSITHCTRDVISDCHPSWKDNTVKNKCHSYMSLIFVITTNEQMPTLRRFRNIHCAICNFAGTELSAKCFIRTVKPPGPMSLSWMMDVNDRDGNQVGEKKGCNKGEIYDPFFKKCRTMTCVGPGYIVKNGKCEPS